MDYIVYLGSSLIVHAISTINNNINFMSLTYLTEVFSLRPHRVDNYIIYS